MPIRGLETFDKQAIWILVHRRPDPHRPSFLPTLELVDGFEQSCGGESIKRFQARESLDKRSLMRCFFIDAAHLTKRDKEIMFQVLVDWLSGRSIDRIYE